ncbi:PAS domain S-box protein [Devosia salina]|uniref:histidine kinase n=1 Tax=Devosia salina TaxID=2860336 RepID=A0ABX8WAR7_9HYPH|nr:PAS domain S-box protein [Devosia salina]QYO75210.1 PAS domain S-box protein [Devosia salina]
MSTFAELSRPAARAFDLLMHPVWVFSTDTLAILASNRAAQDWLGFSAAELEALTIADLRPERAREALVEQVKTFEGEACDGGMWTIAAKDGRLFRVSFHWRRVIFDGATAVVATIQDKTEAVDTRSAAADLMAKVEDLRDRSAQSELRYRQIFEAAPGKMLVVRPQTYEIVAVTQEYAQATMIDPSGIYGRSLFEVFPDDSEDPASDGVRNLSTSLARVEKFGAPDVMHVQKYPVRRQDGHFEERHWLPTNKPVYDEAGQLAFIIHRVEDVTNLVKEFGAEQVDAEAAKGALLSILLELTELRTSLTALQEREARLRTAERLLELGSWEYDIASGAMNWSPRVFDIFGLPKENVTPDFEGYVALVHPEDRQQMIDACSLFERSGEPHIVFQHRIIRSDGTVCHIRGVGERHDLDGKQIIVGSVQDISDVVASQEKLADLVRQQRFAGRLAKLGSWRFDVDPPKLSWSPETAAIHGEAAGFSPTVEGGIKYYAPEHRETIRVAFSICLETGAPFDEILQLDPANGNRIWVRTIGEAVKDDQGKIIAVEGAFQDISELVAARDDADALARRLHQTLDSISDAFFLVDEGWRFAYLNSQAEALLQRQRGDLLGKVIWDEFSDAANSRFQREYEKSVRTGRPTNFDEYFAPLESWFAVSAYPTPEGLAVYFRDITTSRAREEQLRLLESAVSRQNDILLITEAEPIEGPDGPRIVYVNDAFVRRTGYRPEEVIGRSPRILQGPKTQRHELSRIRKALETWQPVRAELINYTRTGDEFWLELDIVPIANDDGWFTHWVAVERDISERKYAEENLRIGDERFQLVARATNDVIWDWDLVNNTVWWNKNLKDVYGLDPAEVEPDARSWTNRIHPEDRQRVLDSIHAVIDGSASHWSSEYRFQHFAGRYLDVIDRGFVIRNEDGKATRMLGSMLDVTHRRDLEARLRQAQKLEAVGQLTGGVAHDFNNLLTVILGNSELLIEELEDRPELRVLASMSMSAAQRGAEMTTRLLAFARKQPLEPVLIDLNELVAGMEELLRRTLGEQVDIEWVRADRLWTIEADPGQLESALLNLAINARDAMPGGGHLTIETANVSLDDDDVASTLDSAPGQYVLLAVTDTGHGIPRELIDQLFEPFFTTKDAGKGSGLGLSMVYGFVRQSGGHIRVYSEPGEGTCFKLYFPRSFGSSEKQPEIRARAPNLGGRELILIVEDDRLVRENLANQLERLGYRVHTAGSGDQALQVLEETPDIDLLFTDVVMPGMNGRQLADRALALRPGLKILFTSGYTENAIVHHGRLDRGVDLLSKPYRRDQLAAKLRKMLGS